jgi:hypothetical protein
MQIPSAALLEFAGKTAGCFANTLSRHAFFVDQTLTSTPRSFLMGPLLAQGSPLASAFRGRFDRLRNSKDKG